jgi:hypothetical protein
MTDEKVRMKVFGIIEICEENKKKTGQNIKLENGIWYAYLKKDTQHHSGEQVMIEYETAGTPEKPFNVARTIDIVDLSQQQNKEEQTNLKIEPQLQTKYPPGSYDYFVEELVGLTTKEEAILNAALLRIAYELYRMNNIKEAK